MSRGTTPGPGSPAGAGAGSVTRARRLAFGAIVLAGVVAVCEGAGRVTLGRLAGPDATPRRLQEERDAILAAASPTAPATPRDFQGGAVLHPFLGFVAEPARRVRSPVSDDVWTVGRDGFFGPTGIVQTRGPDRVVIGVTGGSMATILAQLGADALRGALGRSPAFADKEIVLVNLALGGYKQPQQLLAVTLALVQGAEFDLVLNLDGFNDVALHPAENQRAGVHPLYPRSWHVLARQGLDPRTLDLLVDAAAVERRRRRLARAFGLPVVRAAYATNVAWKALDDPLARARAALLARAQRETAGPLPFAARGPAVDLPDADATYAALAELWRRGSLELDGLCRANGIAYLHFLQPNQYDDGSKPMREDERRRAVVPDHPYAAGVRNGYPRLRAAGRELAAAGVRFTDLSRLFATHAEPLYVDTCCHVGPEGTALLARAVADAVTAAWPPAPGATR